MHLKSEAVNHYTDSTLINLTVEWKTQATAQNVDLRSGQEEACEQQTKLCPPKPQRLPYDRIKSKLQMR